MSSKLNLKLTRVGFSQFLSRLLQVVELEAERLDHVAYNFIFDLLVKAGKGTKTDIVFKIEEDAGVLSVFGDGEWRALDDEFPRGETWAFLQDPERCQLPTLESPPLPPVQPEAPPPPPELPSQPRVPPVRSRPPQPRPASVDKPTTRTSPRRSSPPSDSDSDSDSSKEDSDESDDDGSQGGAHVDGGERGGEDTGPAGESGEQSNEGSESEGGGADNGGSESSGESRPVTPTTPACNEELVRTALAPHKLKLEDMEDPNRLYGKTGFTKKASAAVVCDIVRTVLRGGVAVNAVNGGAEADVGRAPEREADAGGSATITSILGVVTAQQAALLKFMEKQLEKQQEDAKEERAGLVTSMMTNMQAMSQKQTDGMQAFARSLMQSTARHPAFRIAGDRPNP